ncbi:MAG: DUF4389 domain-containing protein [Rhizomicrobium sp.]|jgi:hypothetical protein
MTNTDGGTADSRATTPARTPFPFVRLLYAIGFGLLAWLAFDLVLLLAIVQFVMFAVSGRINEELKAFSLSLVQYIWELLAFITFVRDEQPFPIGPFPKQ